MPDKVDNAFFQVDEPIFKWMKNECLKALKSFSSFEPLHRSSEPAFLCPKDTLLRYPFIFRCCKIELSECNNELYQWYNNIRLWKSRPQPPTNAFTKTTFNIILHAFTVSV